MYYVYIIIQLEELELELIVSTKTTKNIVCFFFCGGIEESKDEAELPERERERIVYNYAQHNTRKEKKKKKKISVKKLNLTETETSKSGKSHI